jgi:hypothetical protein
MKSIMNRASPQHSAGQRPAPTKAEIVVEAESLWRRRGCPAGHDVEIWLEAERQLCRVQHSERDDRDSIALANPLARLDNRSEGVMGELDELFPETVGRATTSL